VAIAAWAAFTIAWFLPTVYAKAEFSLRLSGWKAFLAAGTVAWDDGKTEFEWLRVLSLVGMLSNVLVLISPWMLLRYARVPRWFAIGIAAAFAVNLAWLAAIKATDLRVGYWLWIGSMGALAVIAILRRGGLRRAAAVRESKTFP